MKQIDRIKTMEEKYDKVLRATFDLDKALDNYKAVIPEIEELIAYYESYLWREDYSASSNNRLPLDLKCGVLSQDGVYNLLSDYQRLKELFHF